STLAVILSGAETSRSEVSAESKDPCSFPRPQTPGCRVPHTFAFFANVWALRATSDSAVAGLLERLIGKDSACCWRHPRSRHSARPQPGRTVRRNPEDCRC